MKWLKSWFAKRDSSINPPMDVPLTDKPGELLQVRTKAHSSGKFECIETKVNVAELDRVVKMTAKWFKR